MKKENNVIKIVKETTSKGMTDRTKMHIDRPNPHAIRVISGDLPQQASGETE